MKTLLVWLLVTSSDVNGGSVTTFSPFMYPDLKACQQVLDNLPTARYRVNRCIQTSVLVAQ